MPSPRKQGPPRPPIDWEAHVDAAQMEDVQFLLTRGHCTLEQALARVGLSVTAYKQRLHRHRDLSEAR